MENSQERQQILVTTFKVACEIYKYEEYHENVWTEKLIKSLEGKILKDKILRSINELNDFNILNYEYGDTEPGKHGRLLKISPECKHLIKELYDKYWKIPGDDWL